MAVVTLDKTGVLLVGAKKVFPIGFSDPPPMGKKAWNGKPALEELGGNGGNFVRTGPPDFGHVPWAAGKIDAQIKAVKDRLDEAAQHGMYGWVYLGTLPNFPPRAQGAPPSANEQLLATILGQLKGHRALGAYKGYDEPANGGVGQAGLVRAYKRLRNKPNPLDPNHPVVIIQAPNRTADALKVYRPAFDVTGVDIFPVAYPPEKHSDSKNTDISVVGEMTKKMVAAAGPSKPVWTTLQIAWTGTTPEAGHARIPCFPSLHEERFMAYDAIVNGARGLMFFGGHTKSVCNPADAQLGWNWTFWRQVLRPVVSQLGSAELQPALLAPNSSDKIGTKRVSAKTSPDIELVTRRAAGFLYVIAVKRSPDGAHVEFSGLPRRLTTGEVLFEYVQDPPPKTKNPPRPPKQVFRRVPVANGAFQDRFRGHDVHVYRFKL